jgi:hypothetical protein
MTNKVKYALTAFEDHEFDIDLTAYMEIQGKFLIIKYELLGEVDKILYPNQTDRSQRAEGLWDNTCFELFVKPIKSENYLEFNFSPSNQWNCYHFSTYRTDMTKYLKEDQINMNVDIQENSISLEVEINTMDDTFLENFNEDKIFYQANLSSLIVFNEEGTDFKKKYHYAYTHNDVFPDFHNHEKFSIFL